jgi:hypothetical protein
MFSEKQRREIEKLLMPLLLIIGSGTIAIIFFGQMKPEFQDSVLVLCIIYICIICLIVTLIGMLVWIMEGIIDDRKNHLQRIKSFFQKFRG